MAPRHTFGTIVAVSALLTGLLTGVGWAESRVTAAAVSLSGAGATFPVPLYKKWIAAYQESHPTVAITYQGVGSGEGIKRFLAEIVDFAGSDEFLSAEDAAKVERGAATVPATAGMVVLAYNIPGVTGEIRLPRDVFADITAFFAVDISKGGRTGYLVEMGSTHQIFTDPREELTKEYISGKFS